MPIHLYAEHLLHIRTLSISASLSTPCNQQTRATLAADGSDLTLTHEGDEASIQLPISVTGHSDATLTTPSAPSKELSFRIRLPGAAGSDVLTTGDHEAANIVPWGASDLSPETEICCAACSAVLLRRGAVTVWKDLPSEGWAEMMEFWHCHKPDVPRGVAQPGGGGGARGISADSALAVERGVGLVDAMGFLLAEGECRNVEPQQTSRNDEEATCLNCARCIRPVGSVDTPTGGIKLHKPQLAISTSSSAPLLSYSLEKWLSCRLITAIECTGARKFLIHAKQRGHNEAIKAWIFTPDLTVSSSASQSARPFRAAKILWQHVDYPPASETHNGNGIKMNGESLSTDEIELSSLEVVELDKILRASTLLLPEHARDFQGWRVGLLERFTSADTTR